MMLEDAASNNFADSSAAEISRLIPNCPAASALLMPGLSCGDYAKILAEQQLSDYAVAFLATGLKDIPGVQWAKESARMVSDRLPESEIELLRATEAWLHGEDTLPVIETLLQPSAYQGPGSWAAQAALWAANSAVDVIRGERLTPVAVQGAVRLAAAIQADSWTPTALSREHWALEHGAFSGPEPPSQPQVVGEPWLCAELNSVVNAILAPFVALGRAIAATPPSAFERPLPPNITF